MSIVIEELVNSRAWTFSGSGTRTRRQYRATGSDSDADVRSAAASALPATIEGLIREPIQLEPGRVIDEDLGVGDWLITCEWIAPEARREEPETEADFKIVNYAIGGESYRQEHSPSSTPYPAAGRSAPPFSNLIGADAQGVQGVDMEAPVAEWSETHYLPVASITNSYLMAVEDLFHRVNDASFRGRAAHEVLFVGMSARNRGPLGTPTDVECTFTFRAKRNKTSQTIAGITGIAIDAWAVIDIRTEAIADEDSQTITRRPTGVIIHRPRLEGDFSILGIGTT